MKRRRRGMIASSLDQGYSPVRPVDSFQSGNNGEVGR